MKEEEKYLKTNQTRVTWADLHLDQFLPLYGAILTHSELFGAILTQFGLVWYGLVSYFTYWTHFELFEATWDILEHLKERYFFKSVKKK